MDVTVCVGTYGEEWWRELAQERAIPSVPNGTPTIHVHGESLAGARNEAASNAETEWLCFLDGDDQLSPDYFEHMARGTCDLRGPSCRYATRHPSPRMPTVWKIGDLYDLNYLVIGTLVRREMFFAAGGFGDEPVYEDYALWCRCAKLGATSEIIPGAVYLAWRRSNSRNRSHSMRFKNEWHYRIRNEVWPERAA